MASRVALYVMPSFAVLATAALVLGPGRERPAVGARLWGLPADGGTRAAWRIETFERQYGSDRAVAVDPLDVSVSLGRERIASWTGRSGDDGIAEAELAKSTAPLSGPIEVTITSGRQVLGTGPIPQRPAPPLTLEKRTVEGTASGPTRLTVSVERGVLASPFPGALRVVAMRDGQPAEGVILTPTANGADVLLTDMQVTTNASGEARFTLLPTWHAVELKIEAKDPRADPPKSTWEGGLPVQPGALYLGASRPIADVLSPVPRDRIYVSALGSGGRLFGAIVALSKNEAGLYQGKLDTTPMTRLGAEAVTLAGDSQELGSGTVTWPLDSPWAVASPPRVELLYDGIPSAVKREQDRAFRARIASVGVAFLAAVLEVILLVLYSRESQRRLAAHLAQLGEDEGERAAASRIAAAPASRAIMLVMAVGLVLLGFGAVAAFSIVR